VPTRPLKLRYCGYRSWIDLYDGTIRYDIVVAIVSFFQFDDWMVVVVAYTWTQASDT